MLNYHALLVISEHFNCLTLAMDPVDLYQPKHSILI